MASNPNMLLPSSLSLRSIDAFDNFERQQTRRASRMAAAAGLENIGPATRNFQQTILNNIPYPSEVNRGKHLWAQHLFSKIVFFIVVFVSENFWHKSNIEFHTRTFDFLR